MDEIAQIQRLGWDWRSDGLGIGLGPGVVLSVQINGRTLRAFVPLSHVWLAFSNHGPLPAIAPGSLISLQRVA